MSALLSAINARHSHDVVIEQLNASASAPLVSAALTAGQLRAAVADVRDRLKKLGIERVALLAGNSAAWIAVDIACHAGAVCLLPLPVFFSSAQLLHSVGATGVSAILTDDPARVRAVFGDRVVAVDEQRCAGLSLLHLRVTRQPCLPAGTQKVTFTSGSTGSPRGVCLSVDQQLNVALALQSAIQLSAPRHLCVLPLSTLLENIGGVYYPLLAGGTVTPPPETVVGFSGSTGLDCERLLQAIVRHQPTSIILLPQMLVGLVAALEQGWTPPASLAFVAVGGAKVAAGLIERARRYGLPVYEGYGLSETASVACLNVPNSIRPGSVGKPLSHVSLAVEDDELVLSGNSFLGYIDAPDSWGTAAVATGDLGSIDADGFVYLHGRRKNLLISSFGRNISPEWIESELQASPEISQCIVFGDARPYCTALIAVADPAIDDARVHELVATVNAGLPDYARVQRWHRLPAALTRADGLYTDNGRPRRDAIARVYASVIDDFYAAEPAVNI